MEQASVVLGWFALALYIAATVLYAYQFLLKRPAIAWWARFATGAGFVCQTASIGLHSMVTHGTEMTGGNSLVLASWVLVLIYFIVEHLIKIRVYGTFLVPLAAVLLIIAHLMGVGSTGTALGPEQLNQLDSWRVGIHVALIFAANAGFLVSAASSAFYLIQDRQLKRRRTTPLFRKLPSLAQTQKVARRSVVFAFPAYTAGITLGVIRAIETDVSGWWADPRIMLAGVVWVIYGTYLLLVYRRGVSARAASWVSLAGFAVVLLVGVIARTLPIGFHVFGI
jgi:HemX protein